MPTASVRPDDTLPGLSDPAELRPRDLPKRVGPYQLLAELAQGGMGRVYLARERGEGGYTRLVALKRIHDHLSREKAFVDMFLDEARIASQIQHPHVCTVFDFGRADESFFISMEYLRGLPLSEVLRELGTSSPSASPRRYAMAAHLLSQACEGLHAAHELRDAKGKLLQVVHRDVSPHNLFVTFDGTLRVLDFGIARAVDRIAESTTGRVKGKFAYMAPEQALGRAVDRRSDIFSVGVVLWEFCTLERLFKRDSPAETVLNVVRDETQRPSEFVPDVPLEIEQICMRALAKDPAERFSSAREMGQALARATAALGPPTTAGDVAEWMADLFPGAPQQSLTVFASHTALTDQPPGEVTGFRPKSTPLTRSPRRRSVPAFVAIISVVLAAVSAFALARITQTEPERQTLPQMEPRAEPVLTPPDDPSGTFEEPVDLTFEAPETPAAPETPRRRRAERATAPRSARRRRARRRPAAAAPVATGQVRVGGPPAIWDAPILFRGRRLGVVPDTIVLPAGTQTIEIRVPGRGAVQRRVEVRAGQVTRVTIR